MVNPWAIIESHAEVIRKLTEDNERLQKQVNQFRDTNRRFNRRVQLLEGWWQRKVERAKLDRSMYFGFLVKDKKGEVPNLAAIEEVAYQRGYEEGLDQRFNIPKRRVVPRKAE